MAERKLGKIFPLDWIVEEEPVVFLDTCVIPGSLFSLFRDVNKFREVSLPGLSVLNQEVSELVTLWSHKNTYSTPKVLTELNKLVVKLYCQFKYLKSEEKKEYLPRWKQDDYRELKSIMGREEMHGVCSLYRKQLLGTAELSLYSPSDQEIFELLEHKVIEIGKENSVKRYSPKRNGKADLHTDEQLVATALYHSLIEKSSSAIVSKDSDIQRLLVQTQICFNEHSDFWRISRALKDNPVRVYFVIGKGKVECNVDTSQSDSFRYAYSSRRARAARANLNE